MPFSLSSLRGPFKFATRSARVQKPRPHKVSFKISPWFQAGSRQYCSKVRARTEGRGVRNGAQDLQYFEVCRDLLCLRMRIRVVTCRDTQSYFCNQPRVISRDELPPTGGPSRSMTTHDKVAQHLRNRGGWRAMVCRSVLGTVSAAGSLDGDRAGFPGKENHDTRTLCESQS
jgi:hypothetical protein